jgi:hypothetical protein
VPQDLVQEVQAFHRKAQSIWHGWVLQFCLKTMAAQTFPPWAALVITDRTFD